MTDTTEAIDPVVLLGGDDAARTVLGIETVAEAVRARDADQVRQALLRARALATTAERAAIEEVLSRRRLFVRRAGPPTMFTFNGIGTRLYGAADRDRNGTYIATLYATLVYLPVLPLSSWWVVPAESRGFLSRGSWRFFGRVPLSRAHRLWQWIVLGGIAALIGWLALGAHHRATHADVAVVNGLDVIVVAQIGDEKVTVAAGGVARVSLSSGRTHVVTTTEMGVPVEELDIDVPGDTDLVAYDVLGAAPIRIVDVEYFSNASRSPGSGRSPRIEDHVGEAFVARDGIQYVFEKPPESVKMTGTHEVRRWAMVVDGGWHTAAPMLGVGGSIDRAADLVERVALAQGDDESLQAAEAIVATADGRRVLALGERAVARSPESIIAHRVLQDGLRLAGKDGEARARYRPAWEKDPSSVRAGYLYARTLPDAEAAPILERLDATGPGDRWVIRARWWHAYTSRRWTDAIGHLDRLVALDASLEAGLISARADCLVGMGKVDGAQRLVRGALGRGTWDLLVVYGKLARLPRADRSLASAMEVVSSVLSDESGVIDARAQLAAQIRDAREFGSRAGAVSAAVRQAGELMLLSTTDPSAAAREAAHAPREALANLDDASRIAIACALLRAGDERRARDVYTANVSGLAILVAFDALRAPERAFESDHLDFETRAALAYAASFGANDAAERDRLLAIAKENDLLQAVVPR